jgi:histidinol-phosphate aminotransferase
MLSLCAEKRIAMAKPRPAVQKLEPYTGPPEGRKGKLRLDFNENTLGCSPAVLRVLKTFTAEDISIYPEYGELRVRLAKHCGVSPENILLTNGSDEAIRYIFDAYIERGQEIIIPVPTFSMISIYARLRQAKITEIPYNRDLSFPTGRVLKSISGSTRLVVLVNPNNPTGTEISARNVEQIVRKAANSLVVVDEAYHQYLGHSAISLISKYPNVLVVQTLSKAYGLAGLRVGYIVGPAATIAALSKVISPYSVNAVAVACAKAALTDRRYTARYVRQVKDAKDFLRSGLTRLGLKVYPSGANFFLANFAEKAHFAVEALRKEGILVRDRSSEPLLEGCVRIGIGTRAQCTRLLESLLRILSPKAIIFDMDGVLIDVSRSYRRAIKQTAEHFTGRRISYGEIQKAKEQGNANNDWVLTKRLIDRMGGGASLEQVVAHFQRIYLGTPRKPGLINSEKWMLKKKVLNFLASSFKLGIVTGRPRYEAELALKMWDVSDKFLCLIAMEDADGKMKPDPYPLRKAMKELHATECIYVGDTVDDIVAAVNAGCIPVGVLPAGLKGAAQPRPLETSGAKKVLASVNKLPDLLSEIGF